LVALMASWTALYCLSGTVRAAWNGIMGR
jgi:hypothetical protein